MARINRTDVIQKAVNDLGISMSGEKIPNETLDKVQLTYSLNKQFSGFLASSSQTTTGTFSVTMPTVSAGAETYITAIQFGLIKDATCDIASGTVLVTCTPAEAGISKNLILIPVLTLTAQSENITLSLPYPLKVKNAANISVGGTFTVGALSRAINVVGFVTSSN